MDRLPQLTSRLVGARAFEYAIIALILASGALLGLGASPGVVERYGDALTRGNQIILAVFIVEAALKIPPSPRNRSATSATAGTSLTSPSSSSPSCPPPARSRWSRGSDACCACCA